MSYTIHTLGQGVEIVENRQEANWVLGSRYGANVYNKSLKNRGIVYGDTFVKINPDIVNETKNQIIIEKTNSGYRI